MWLTDWLTYRCTDRRMSAALRAGPRHGGWRFTQHGDTVSGRAGPTPFTSAWHHRAGTIVHRMEATMAERPYGTFWGEVSLALRPSGTARLMIRCDTGPVRFTLERVRG